MIDPLPRSFRYDPSSRTLRLDPRDLGFFQNPYPAYRRLHDIGGVFRWADIGCLAAVSHTLVSALLRDRRFGRIVPADAEGRPDSSGRPEHARDFYAVEANSLLDLEAPTHARLRGLVTRAFVSRQIERLAPGIERLAHSLIDGFAGDGAVELVEAFAAPLPVIVVAELLGIDRGEAPRLLDWSHRMVAMYQFGRTEAVEREANRAAAEFSAFMRDVIAAKRRTPADDLVSGLIAAEADGGRLSEAEMISTLILLMNAGHEATVHQVGNAVKAIVEAGGDAAALFSDEDRTRHTVEEVLRFDTPLHLFRRVALEGVELGDGLRLERGEEVALLLGAANRDPAVFAAPDRFDPARAGPAHVSFGGGVHFCLGAPLARLELGIALCTLFARLPDLVLAEPPRYHDSYHFHGLERLALRFTPVGD